MDDDELIARLAGGDDRARPATDRGGWIAAMIVFAIGLAAYTLRGPRVRPSGE